MKVSEKQALRAGVDLKKITELIPGLVVVYNVNTGEYVYVNKSIKKILGYPPSDFINKGLQFAAALVHPDDLPVIIKKNNDALKTANEQETKTLGNEAIVNFEYRMRHRNGNWVWLHTDGIVYDRTPEGRVDHVMNISLDITGRKQSEEDLQRFTRELQTLNKTKDEFISIASHQLRTPATAVKQYLGLLLGGYSDPLTESQSVFLERAYESNERQLRIVEDILKIAQVDAEKLRLELKSYDLRQITDESIAALQNLFDKKNQKVVFKIPKKAVKARVDRNQIRMVLENLLENASNYSRPNKRITVSVASGDGQASVSVRDQGVGIAKKDFPRLFEKFSRIPNPLSLEADGTGLGLYWAKRIARLHQGDISVKSTAGRGSVFTLTIPDKR